MRCCKEEYVQKKIMFGHDFFPQRRRACFARELFCTRSYIWKGHSQFGVEMLFSSDIGLLVTQVFRQGRNSSLFIRPHNNTSLSTECDPTPSSLKSRLGVWDIIFMGINTVSNVPVNVLRRCLTGCTYHKGQLSWRLHLRRDNEFWDMLKTV